MRSKAACFAVLLLCATIGWAEDKLPGRKKPVATATAESKQAQLNALLVKACPCVFSTNLPAPPPDAPQDSSPYLTVAENQRLERLLYDDEATKTLRLEVVLAAAKQQQLSGPNSFHFHNLMGLLNERWPRDPATIAFFREALSMRPAVATAYLRSLENVWDRSFLMPVIEHMESNHLDNAMAVLNGHADEWAQDVAIRRRLSNTVLAAYPGLTNATARPQPVDSGWYECTTKLVQSHDLAMIPVLRQFLKDKTIAGSGLKGEDFTPCRACDLAAAGIREMLGDQPANEDRFSYTGFIRTDTVNYPKWKEWDRRIEELEKRLDKLP